MHKTFLPFHGNNVYINARQCYIIRSLADFLLHHSNGTVGSPTTGSDIKEYYET